MTNPASLSPRWEKPGSKSILIVDDDAAIRALMTDLLTGRGFRVQSAMNSEEAINQLRQAAPDLLVLDLMMPEIGGYDIIKQLHQADLKIPVMIVTASVLDNSTAQMLRSEPNVAELVQKPLDTARFIEAVHRILKTRPRPADAA